MLSAFHRIFAGKSKAGIELDIERDYILRIFLNDAQCLLIASDRAGLEVLRRERLAEAAADSAILLAAAVESLPADAERRIGKVEIFLDDPEISLVDSRQAKLNHFEGRTLAEFGKAQLGGKPACFASHKFGETSPQEAEKRVVACISEDRLTSVLFALGKLARYANFFGPWSVQSLFSAGGQDSWAHLCVHRGYSTLTLANASAGALAFRQVGFGVNRLAKAYAAVHGITEAEAQAAMAARRRLGPPTPAPEDAAAHTGSFLALSPVLTDLAHELAVTSEYFEFQRLAGAASSLLLSTCGARIAGFSDWLGEMLQMDVVACEDRLDDGPAGVPVLNLLEGLRTGLLKIGNQHYDFVGGQFVPSRKDAGESADSGSRSTLARWKALSTQPVTAATLKSLATPALAAVLALSVIAGAWHFLMAPGGVDADTAGNLYRATLARLDRAKQPAAAGRIEPILWARDLIVLSDEMPYDMKLKRIALAPASGNGVPALEITGELPQGGTENLQLIGRFIARLGGSVVLRRRFADVSFAGAGDGQSKADGAMAFQVIAKLKRVP